MGEDKIKRKRVHCFIDGFNLYHAIHELKPKANYLKWLDLWKLARAFTTPSSESLTGVSYFTAFATWISGAHKRHRAYIEALECSGVTVIKGQFKRKEKSCPSCHRKISTYEEKESDVNLGIHLVHQAHTDGFDKALVITADSDFLPAIRLILEYFPKKEVRILIPPGRYKISRDLRNSVGASRIKLHHLKNSLLPEIVHDEAGRVVTVRPDKYKPSPQA